VNFAFLAARDGARVLLWDLDPQASATYLLRVKPRIKGGGRRLVLGQTDIDSRIKATDYDRFDLLPGDLSYRHLDLILDENKRPTRRLRRLLAPLRDEYDLVILDCPPGITLLAESIFEAADALLVPLIPSTLSMRTLDQLESFLDDGVDRRPDVLAFFSMVDRRRRIHRDVLETAPRRRTVVLGSSIPAASDVELMGVHRAAVAAFAPRGRAAVAYDAVWREIHGHVAHRAPR
jgi:chromosome partitioning protein